MLVWINGPFGGGKTQTAFEIHRRLPGSVVCDPEEVGYGLHRTMPAYLRDDFQHLRSWRDGVVEVLDLVLTRHAGTVIAPMTVVDPGYFAETVGELRERGHDVRHVALLARHDTVRRRLRERELFGLRHDSFAVDRIAYCLDRLRAPEFADHMWTDELPIPGVADRIATACELTLSPNTAGALRNRYRRVVTGLRHIRFG